MSKKIPNKKLLSERKMEKKKRKIRRNVILVVIVAVIIAAVTLISVISSLPATFTNDNGRFTNKKTGEVYIQAPDNVEPVSYKQDPYGKWDDFYIYPISTKNTSDWLALNDYGMFRILYREGNTIPELKDFSPAEIRVCDDGERIIRIANIDNGESVNKIVDNILNGEPVSKPTSVASVYSLRITSSQYTWMYYRITFIITPDSKCYYYDRTSERCVLAEDDIIFESIKGELEYQDETTASVSSDEVTG